MTYIQEIDQRTCPRLEGANFIQEEKEAIIEHVCKINELLHHKALREIKKPKSLMLISEVVKVEAQKVDHLLKEITEKQEQARRKLSAFGSAEK